MTDTLVEEVETETVQQAVERLLRDLPSKSIGEFVKTDQVVDMLLDLQQITKN
jgi:hypothetical protein